MNEKRKRRLHYKWIQRCRKAWRRAIYDAYHRGYFEWIEVYNPWFHYWDELNELKKLDKRYIRKIYGKGT